MKKKQDRILEIVVYRSKFGAKQHLNQAELEELSEYMVTVGKIGFGTLRKHQKIAEKVAVEEEVLTKDKIINGWLASFMKRHPELSSQKENCASQSHMDAMDNRYHTVQ